MIERYTLPEMAEIWSKQSKLQTWLRVELAIVDALSQEGRIPRDAADRIRENARVDAARVEELEEVTKHDVLSFVECVGDSLGGDSRYFHMGVTSSDILDTSVALLTRDATRLILKELTELEGVIAELAKEHEQTLIVGRTHGMHAEPTSLGLKFAVWYNSIARAITRMEQALDQVCVGKVSGSVGNYSHLSPEVEDRVLEILTLKSERPATQVVQRDRHAHFVSSLALAASSIETIAVELRNLQRTEIAEVEEPFTPGQKGSSSMPHKRNPIMLERISGLSRLVRSYAIAALENVPLWHERDISHSSVERVIIPDGTITLHYMARMMVLVLNGLKVDVFRTRQNIEITKGLIYSQRLMLSLMQAGWERKIAYEKVQHLAQSAASGGGHLKDLACQDDEVVSALGREAIEGVFDPLFYSRYAHQILQQLGIL